MEFINKGSTLWHLDGLDVHGKKTMDACCEASTSLELTSYSSDSAVQTSTRSLTCMSTSAAQPPKHTLSALRANLRVKPPKASKTMANPQQCFHSIYLWSPEIHSALVAVKPRCQLAQLCLFCTSTCRAQGYPKPKPQALTPTEGHPIPKP